MNGMNPLQVPELLREIAAFVESPRSLSSFAQVDRFVSAAVTPCLFRNIEVDLSSIGSLAQALCNEPERAASCRSLSFRGHREKADWDYSAIQKLHTNIITIFGVIFTHGRLASLKWTWRSRQTPFSEEVWQAISSVAGSLQELDISILEEEDDTWECLTRTRFAHLRILRIDLSSAHGWACGHLQSMLNTLCDLEELSLQFPMCCPPGGITLDTTHP
ncbi:hypothetical protein B0H14DRAFT_2736391, partial [Mycena olivaceomarginata]